jgi:2-keto-3-deoxy-L-rhamnonate aldolase RhmA
MNAFRERVLNREVLAGVWLSLGLGQAAEMAALAGYDWLLVDREHGSRDDRDLLAQLWAAQTQGTAVVVRAASMSVAEIKHVLDLGPDGIMIPNIGSEEEAREVVRLCCVPPVGTRGTATTTRAARYGLPGPAAAEPVIILQIESPQGVENAQAIAEVAGVDVLFTGPHDLSVDLRASGVTDSEALEKAINRIAVAAVGAGKVAGILSRTPEQTINRWTAGYTLLACGSDRGLLAAGLRANSERLRAALDAGIHTEVQHG